MRTYEETHPWINFSLDLRNISCHTWLLIGEAVSKIEHIAGVPLPPLVAEELHKIYLAKGALATTAIEGNTLSEDEVLKHLDGDLELPTSRQYLTQEIDNIVDACNEISTLTIQNGNQKITTNDIKNYNSQVLNKLPLDEDVVPGEFRSHSVIVGRYRGAPAEDCSYLLDKFCEWLNNLAFPENMESPYSIFAAIAAHLYFVWIHPFGDGNGRTARLIEFRFLLQAGFPTPAAHLLSNFYNLTRTEYYRKLDQASRLNGDMNEFIEYAAQGLVDQLREQLNFIKSIQWDISWRNYVYEQFREHNSDAHTRRRRLVIDMSTVTENDGWIKTSSLQDLSPRIAREYANKTKKTLSRDLNELENMKLIQKKGRMVRANKSLILAFLPERATSNAT